MPPHLTTHVSVGRCGECGRIRPFHLPHHHPLLYSVCGVVCGGVFEILGVVNIRDEGGVSIMATKVSGKAKPKICEGA